MGPFRTRLQVFALSSILVPSAIGVVAVHASPTCDRVVRTYVTTPVRNRVSKATAIAWEKWRVGHPNWKPNPRVSRPKYVLSRKEAMKKVELACEVPAMPTALDIALTPADVGPPPSALDMPPMSGPPMLFPDVVPTQVAELTPEDSPYAPGGFPLFPGAPGGGIPGIPGVPGGISSPPVSTPNVPTTGTSTPPIGTSGTPPTDVPPVLPVVPPVIAATPEPSSLLLLATGLAGICLLLHKRVQVAA